MGRKRKYAYYLIVDVVSVSGCYEELPIGHFILLIFAACHQSEEKTITYKLDKVIYDMVEAFVEE